MDTLFEFFMYVLESVLSLDYFIYCFGFLGVGCLFGLVRRLL